MSINIAETDLDSWQSVFGNDEINLKDVKLVNSGGLQCTNSRFWDLGFADAANSTFPDPNSVFIPLSSKNLPKPASIGDILTKVGIGSLGDRPQSTFTKLCNSVASSAITFDLDSSEQRNAIWITRSPTGNILRFDTALTLLPATGATTSSIFSSIADSLSVVPSKFDESTLPRIVFQTSSTATQTQSQGPNDKSPVVKWVVTTTYRMSFRVQASSFVFWVTMQPAGPRVTITRNFDTQVSGDVWTDISGLFSPQAGLDTSDAKPVADFLSSTVDLLALTIGMNAQNSPVYTIIAAVTVQKADSTDDGVAVHLSYDSQSKTFSGGLILDGFYSHDDDWKLFGFDPSTELRNPGTNTPPANWDLRQYFAHPDIVPKGLPTSVTAATVALSLTDPKTFAFAASATAPKGSAGPQSGIAVPLPFVWSELDLAFQKSKTDFSCSITTLFELNPLHQPSQGPVIAPADLGLTFAYDPNGWILHGHADNLSGALLCSFFDSDDQSGVSDVLSRLNIAALDLLATHTSEGAAASFLFTGTITIGTLELRLFYQYASSLAGDNTVIAKALQDQGKTDVEKPNGMTADNKPTTSWRFECDLGASDGNATIGTIMNSFIDNATDTLPAFIADIKIPQADGADSRDPVSMKMTKTASGQLLLAFEIIIGPISFTLVQVADATKQTGSNAARAPTKRLLRFAVDKLPIMEHIPLLDKLPQPFDKLEYMWVSETGDGFTKDDVDAVSESGLLVGADALLYKQNVKTDSTTKDEPGPPDNQTSSKPGPDTNPIVLAKGHHFIVINDGKVAIDHVFFASSAKASPNPPPASTSGNAASSGAHTDVAESDSTASNALTKPPDPSPPAKGALTFKLGPLQIDAVTLQFKEVAGKKALQISMDATFTMGPITFSLLGFGFAVTLDGFTLDNLANAVKDADVVLAGMALAFNKPPLLIAGGFEHAKFDTTDGSGKAVTEEVYMGGIGVSFPPYTFVGLGEYAIVTMQDGNSYKSVFLFAKLDGPLITLEFATISGVRLGLGYNSVVRSPEIDELTAFPFINDGSIDGHGNDPMAILKSMTGGSPAWVTPKLDSYWFAAGMTITAFDILKVTAVAILSFRDSGLVAGIYADAIAQMPPDAPKEAVIVYVEIGIVAEMNFVDGYFRVEAALAPTSFLLVQQCHLYGGFALVYWFPPSDHAGDWVFSVGGYHRSYTPPLWYPVPQRLGISFQIDILNITGEAYFAITPKCVMGGAMLHVSLAFGPISAWLDATFDALINFHPLHYIADFSVSIGVTFDADVLFIHIHISCHVGAQLHIEGPEFGGHAHVDFYLFGFDVDFGASPDPPLPLDLLEFWEVLHKPGPASSGAAGVASEHDSSLQSLVTFTPDVNDGHGSDPPEAVAGAAHKYILEQGNFPMPKSPEQSSNQPAQNTGQGEKWYVKGGDFKFRIACDFALSTANVNTTPSTPASTAKIYAKPMHMTDLQYTKSPTTSTLVITITNINTKKITDPWREIKLVPKDVPTALWSPYDPDKDPRSSPPELLNGDNATIPQAMSAMLTAPPPVLSPPFDLPGFIPKFKATAASRFGILDFRSAKQKSSTTEHPIPADEVNGTQWFVPASEATQTEYIPRPQTAAELTQDGPTAWKSMKGFWLGLNGKTELLNDKTTKGTDGKDVTQSGLMSLVAVALKWNDNRPQTEIGAVKELVGNFPTKLVQNLESTYLDLPRVGVVSA